MEQALDFHFIVQIHSAIERPPELFRDIIRVALERWARAVPPSESIAYTLEITPGGGAGVSKPGLDPTTDAIAAQNAARRASEHALGIANAEIAKLRMKLDVASESEARALEMWREAHPDYAFSYPEHAILIPWLLDQLNAAVTEADNARVSGGIEADLRNKLDVWVASRSSDGGKQFKAKVAANADLRRRIDELTKQRDSSDGRAAEANHRHAQSLSALEAMTIKWLELGNEAKRMLGELNEANARRANLVLENEALKKAGPRDSRDVSLATLLDEALARGDQLHADLRDVDAALQETREGLGFANAAVARMMPLCKAAQDWDLGKRHARTIGAFDENLMAVVDAYQKACAQAADKNEQIPASEPASK